MPSETVDRPLRRRTAAIIAAGIGTLLSDC